MVLARRMGLRMLMIHELQKHVLFTRKSFSPFVTSTDLSRYELEELHPGLTFLKHCVILV